jgi:hypothetical protein
MIAAGLERKLAICGTSISRRYDYYRKIRLDSLQRVPEQAVMAAVFVMLKYMIR